MHKSAILKKIKNKNKDGIKEWALVSRKNPKKILKWFGPKKPSEKQVIKEERRIHSFSSINNKYKSGDLTMLKELIQLANHLDEKGLTKEANSLDLIMKKLSQEVIDLDEYRRQREGDQREGGGGSVFSERHYLIFDENGENPIKDAMIVVMSKETRDKILSGEITLKRSDADMGLAFDVRALLEDFLNKELED
jgi:hypothetical protein